MASNGMSCNIVPTGYSLSGTLSLKIRIASFNFFGSSVLKVRISDLRPVENAAKGLFSHRNILSRHAGQP